jgi:hypothetical protein
MQAIDCADTVAVLYNHRHLERCYALSEDFRSPNFGRMVKSALPDYANPNWPDPGLMVTILPCASDRESVLSLERKIHQIATAIEPSFVASVVLSGESETRSAREAYPDVMCIQSNGKPVLKFATSPAEHSAEHLSSIQVDQNWGWIRHNEDGDPWPGGIASLFGDTPVLEVTLHDEFFAEHPTMRLGSTPITVGVSVRYEGRRPAGPVLREAQATRERLARGCRSGACAFLTSERLPRGHVIDLRFMGVDLSRMHWYTGG